MASTQRRGVTRALCGGAAVAAMISGMAWASTSSTYNYDTLNRLICVQTDDATVVTYTYDATGNRTQQVTGTSSCASAAVGIYARQDHIDVLINTPKTFDPRTNDGDPNYPILVTQVTTPTPRNGMVAILGGGTSVTYTPANGYIGTDDQFSYTISNGHGGTATALVTINVSAGGPPDAVADSIVTAENTAKTFDPRTNDTDPNGYALLVSAVTQPANGTAAIQGGGASVKYTPNNGFFGSDPFNYTVSDQHGMTDSAQVAVQVNAGSQGPSAVSDTIDVASNHAYTFDPRLNDTDPYGEPLTIVNAWGAYPGTVTSTSTSVTYSSQNFAGTDSFNYQIKDAHGATATGGIHVNVGAGAITMTPDSYNTTASAPVSFDPTLNDVDPNGAIPYVTGVGSPTAPSHGTAHLDNGHQVTYTPANSTYTGADTFSYQVYDTKVSGSSTITINITANPDQAPVAVADSELLRKTIVYPGGSWTPAGTFNVLSNDSDPDNDTIVITGTTNGSKGTVTNNDTTVTYIYNQVVQSALTDSDTFTYTISDGRGKTATATVTVNINVQTTQ